MTSKRSASGQRFEQGDYLVGHIRLVQCLLSSKHSSKRILEERF